eukprot:g4153.t1
MRWPRVAAVVAAFLVAMAGSSVPAAAAVAAAALDPDVEACLDVCSSKGRPEAALLVCYDVCIAVHERNETACGQALLDASFEHLTLLSFSSGHVFETIAILQAAVFGGRNATSELAAFFAESHLNDRGSPVACSDVAGAHYCLGQGPPMFASLGLCLPQSCGTNFINGVLGNVTDDGSGGLGGAALSFSCGDELRVEADTGTFAVFYLVGALVALVFVGTAVDYCNRLREKGRGSLVSGSGGGGGGVEERKGTGLEHQPHEAEAKGAPLPSRSLLDFVIPDDAAYSDDDCGIRQRLLPPADAGDAAVAAEAGERKLQAEEGGGGDGRGNSHAANASRDRQQQQQQPGHDRQGGGHQGLVQRPGRRWCAEHLECFSLLVNVDSLLAPPRAGDEFRALDGVRTLSMLWVILGNTLLYNCTGIGAGYSNFVDVMPHKGRGLFSSLSGQVIPGSFLAADTFFLMSGFLLSSMLLPKLDAGLLGGGNGVSWRGAWIGKTYLHRYLRLTPTLAFVTLMFWKVLPLLGDGPVFWPLARSLEERCRRYWWTEITYLSSIAPWPPLSNGCILVTWWLSDEFMFFVAGVPLVALYHRLPGAGTALAVLAAAASCLFTLLFYGFHQDARLSYFDLAKTPFAAPWARCPPYLVGILCGMVWHARFRGRVRNCGAGAGDDATGENPARGGGSDGGLEVEGEAAAGRRGPARRRAKRGAMVTALVVLAGLTSAALMALLVYGTYWAYQDMAETRLPPWADHLYLAFSRPAWAFGVALMCLLCFSGHGGLVDWVLTHPGLTTPSRLTYCAYLFHTALLTVLYGSRDVATELTVLEFAVTYMGVVLGTFAGATLLHLLVEAPFRNLESLERRRRLMFSRWRER